MSGGSWPWEAPSIVFYVSRRLGGFQILTNLWDPVGPFKETKDRRGLQILTNVWDRVGPLKETKDQRPEDRKTRDWRLEVTNVSRIVALGSSISRILRVSEAPGTPDSNVAKRS